MVREIEVQEVTCVFCGHEDVVTVNDEVKDERGHFSGFGLDSWDGPCCGERLELYFNHLDFKEFKYYTEKNDWEGLSRFCQDEFDDLSLISLAKYYLREGDFSRAENIAKVLLTINAEDIEAQELINRIQRKDKKIHIKATFGDLQKSFYSCNSHLRFFINPSGYLSIISEVDSNRKVAKENIPLHYIPIPQQNSKENYQLMESFIHEIGEHQGNLEVAGALSLAIKRNKPFHEFKEALLNYPSINGQWLVFEGDVIREKIGGWLCEHNLICEVDKNV